MSDSSENTVVAERRKPARLVAFAFVVASVLGAVAWGAAQGERTFGHVRIAADAGAQEWRGSAQASFAGAALRVTVQGASGEVTIELPWPSGVAEVVSAHVTSAGRVGAGQVELEEAGAFVSGRFSATWTDGSQVSGGWRAAMPSAGASASAIASAAR